MQSLGPPRVRLVVVGVEGEINLGFIARLAANFAIDEFYLVSPVASPESSEARRFAANGVYMLDRVIVVDSLEEALKGVDLAVCTSAKIGQASDVLRHAVTPREFAEEIAPRYESVAVVFGRESVGLTRDELAKCHLLVHIPANPNYPVLNLSHAVAILLYELYNTRRGEKQLHEPARGETLERIYEHLSWLAEKLVDRERVSQVKAALKHILWRCSITGGEASMLYYFAKKLRKRLEAC
ncbi:RNA methyltransferase [Hyperthermus butylicus]|uniref:rRNA methylase n=1 Tax=Hyperthermus butylicus (strain DSM 5456 / JCM 9403 / PLM1-5) TaxID=415426 RepID=A2BNA8_HYPBU|nr:TrmH family RNA methyltransferase [Hyperthermus butylicus]ABM81469.1 rRNA methylase [Hyperthermus butylicus DSM 5456]